MFTIFIQFMCVNLVISNTQLLLLILLSWLLLLFSHLLAQLPLFCVCFHNMVSFQTVPKMIKFMSHFIHVCFHIR